MTWPLLYCKIYQWSHVLFITTNLSVITFIPKKYESYLPLPALSCKTFLCFTFIRENVLGKRARKYIGHLKNLFPEQKKSPIYIYIYNWLLWKWQIFSRTQLRVLREWTNFCVSYLVIFFFIRITFHCGRKLFRLNNIELNCTNKIHYYRKFQKNTFFIIIFFK